MTYALFAAFLACIPVANWLIGNVGTTCVPEGPCLIPVAPGLMAPSGVLMIGLALTLRDALQLRAGKLPVLAAIILGAVLSGMVAPVPLIIASATAFLISELADFGVYTPLADRGHVVLGVLLSGAVGLFIDSALFLYIAFGSLDYLGGQVVGKAYGVLVALPVILAMRSTPPIHPKHA